METDEESYDDEETEAIHWVKPYASLYLIDPRNLESTCKLLQHVRTLAFPFAPAYSVTSKAP